MTLVLGAATAPQNATAQQTGSGAAAAPTRTVAVDGEPVGYRNSGAGEPIVFVMGLGGTMDAWDPATACRSGAWPTPPPRSPRGDHARLEHGAGFARRIDGFL